MFSVSRWKSKPRTGRSETISTCGSVPPEATAEQKARGRGVTPDAAPALAAAQHPSAAAVDATTTLLDTTTPTISVDGDPDQPLADREAARRPAHHDRTDDPAEPLSGSRIDPRDGAVGV